MDDIKLNNIIKNFEVKGNYKKPVPLGAGHIHDTFFVQSTASGGLDYVLQKINNRVFHNVAELMENIFKVSKHIQKRILERPDLYGNLACLEVIQTKSVKSYFVDEFNNYWRLFNYIPDSIKYNKVHSAVQALQEGKAFGQFLALLKDLPPNDLVETIPNFHNVVKRLETFEAVLKSNPVNRAQKLSEEISFVKERAEEMSLLHQMEKEGKLPIRITHNDTKLNNVLFDKFNNPLSVIDLDTVMPGFVAYDFGDAIRTTINTVEEDEADVSKININMQLFEAFAKGFLSETRFFITDEEIASLAFGAKLLTYLMGLRFLTDYLDGDKYYKIQFPEHNLQRARAQFQLLKKMEERYEEMEKVILKEA
jgi:serine/threonine protein kinase